MHRTMAAGEGGDLLAHGRAKGKNKGGKAAHDENFEKKKGDRGGKGFKGGTP